MENKMIKQANTGKPFFKEEIYFSASEKTTGSTMVETSDEYPVNTKPALRV